MWLWSSDGVTKKVGAASGVSRRLVPVTDAMRQLILARVDALDIAGYRQLADLTDGVVSHGTTHRLLTGRQSTVRPRTLEALAEALRLEVDELLAASETTSVPWTLGAQFDVVPVESRPRIERGLQRLLEAAGLM